MMLDFNTLLRNVIEEAAAGLTQSASLVSDRAKQLAPIRKVFGGGQRKLRFLSMEEFERDKSTRSSLGLQAFSPPPYTKGGSGPRPLKVATEQYARTFSASSKRRQYATVVTSGDSANMHVDVLRTLRHPYTAPGKLWSASAYYRLSRRGKSELKSMRAAYQGKLGGRLRGEIHPVPAEIDGRVIRAMVVSPTSYAKFQEFGTRHHPAHPFLRPAAEESSGQVVKAVKTSISPALAAGVPGRGRVVKKYVLKAGG